MSLNGVSSYSYNPYAYNNAYSTNATSFQGYNTTSATSTSEKEGSSLGTLALIGTGIAAVGTAIYAVKKGKKINGADSSVLKNLTTGLKEIGSTIAGKVSKLFAKEGNVNEELTSAAKNVVEKSKAPYSNEAYNKAVAEYKNAIIKKGNEIWDEITSSRRKLNYESILGKK